MNYFLGPDHQTSTSAPCPVFPNKIP
jgi:hypothetical protein